MINLAFDSVNVHGLQPEMQPVLKAHSQIWKDAGLEYDHITSARDGRHGDASWHYFGFAVDFRTWDNEGKQLPFEQKAVLARRLEEYLENFSAYYQVIVEKTHIHVEYDWVLAQIGKQR